MKREFILLISVHGEQTEFPFNIEDDNVTVYNAFLAKEEELKSTGLDIDLFTVFNSLKEQLFTEEIYDEDEDKTIYICRWCGKLIEPNEGVFVEDVNECHCEACHPLLFTEDEWTALYNEYNVDEETEDESSQMGGDFYYWTTVTE